MARQKAIQRKLQKQRRYAVDEIRLREMNREAHRRVASLSEEHVKRQIKDLTGVELDELPSELNKRRRVFLGLEESNQRTPRDVVMHSINRMRDHAECVFRVSHKALFLIQHENGYWYFLYREKGSYYKKSVLYDSSTKAMDRYENEKISWIAFFDESSGS